MTTYANLLSLRPSITLTPTHAVTLELSEAWRWRQSRQDALYLNPFVALPPTENNSARRVGAWTVVDASWRSNRWWTLRAEYVHVNAGPAVLLAGGHDVEFELLNVQFRF